MTKKIDGNLLNEGGSHYLEYSLSVMRCIVNCFRLFSLKFDEHSMLERIYKLHFSIRILIIAILLFSAWNFRFYTTGVSKDELSATEGILYSFSCIEEFKGSDQIILKTSLDKKDIYFSGWQKCDLLTDVMHYANSAQEVIFYTKLNKGILNPDGAIWVHAVKLKSTNEELIYPRNGLGIQYSPNFLVLILVFIALNVLNGLVEELKKSRNGKEGSRE